MNTSLIMLIFGCSVTIIGIFVRDDVIVTIGNIWMVGSIISQKIDKKDIK